MKTSNTDFLKKLSAFFLIIYIQDLYFRIEDCKQGIFYIQDFPLYIG